ncbi:MAG TPA: hypothetical protein VGQ23_14205 [Burkholderiaceae bacterium]|nr:hypothetical protein [Burkholderiaceae bacterium]
MDATAEDTLACDAMFLALVDFKWLMAGLGWWVDLSRLRRDTAYAGECARRGLSSESSVLRRRSQELLVLCRSARAEGAG